MRRYTRLIILRMASLTTATIMVAAAAAGQEIAWPQRVEIPPGTTSLEGVPTVRIDSDETTTTRRLLDTEEADHARLTVKVVNGQFYWTTRGNLLLDLNSNGEFTNLSSSEPGQYIKLTRINDKISYVEHVEMASGSVTWFGELRVVIGK